MRLGPIGFVGNSGAGKTTLICRLVEHYRATTGMRVGIIKHTHHQVDPASRRGDTERFLSCGAHEAILAGNGEAVRWRLYDGDVIAAQWRFDDPRELLEHLESEIVLVEGFKSLDAWPKFVVQNPARAIDPAELSGTVGVVSDTPLDGSLPQFRRDEIEAIAQFLDEVWRR
ncbi:MAG: molybdopterin-guanine dinucleotide biosynthesis protein MobB [Thermoanaerobaculia bacterium]